MMRMDGGDKGKSPMTQEPPLVIHEPSPSYSPPTRVPTAPIPTRTDEIGGEEEVDSGGRRDDESGNVTRRYFQSRWLELPLFNSEETLLSV